MYYKLTRDRILKIGQHLAKSQARAVLFLTYVVFTFTQCWSRDIFLTGVKTLQSCRLIALGQASISWHSKLAINSCAMPANKQCTLAKRMHVDKKCRQSSDWATTRHRSRQDIQVSRLSQDRDVKSHVSRQDTTRLVTLRIPNYYTISQKWGNL